MKAQKSDNGFLDFTFWTISGSPPDVGGGDDGGDDTEPPRWRASSIAAGALGSVVFKGLTADSTGLYANLDGSLVTLLDTSMDGSVLDTDAAGPPTTSLGIARDGLRNGQLAINAMMSTADASVAGIYVTPVPEPATYALLVMGLGVVGFAAGHRQRPG